MQKEMLILSPETILPMRALFFFHFRPKHTSRIYKIQLMAPMPWFVRDERIAIVMKNLNFPVIHTKVSCLVCAWSMARP